MDYSQTLNLPKTDFPMRANLPAREVELLKFWDEIGLYQRVEEHTKGRPPFILHDGPPYANGHIHLGTALNKVLKDMIVKFHSMDGRHAPYVPGWDTHGLPIEQQAIRALNLNRHAVEVLEFRRMCRDYALKFVDIQRAEFKRLGVRGDWEHPYLTLMPHYEARQIGVFGEMATRGYIYKGLKSVYWCASCETALAEAEVEYAEKTSDSIYVRFQVTDGKGLLPENSYVVIWTTTPWTIPANVGVCLHPAFEYVLLAAPDGSNYLVAQGLAGSFLAATGLTGTRVVSSFRGADLAGVLVAHPLGFRTSTVVHDEYVSLEQGTGCVHTAPGHGVEDFEVGRRWGLPVISPVDGRGVFTAEAGLFAGQFYLKANGPILEELQNRGLLMGAGKISHQYPHCWRCKQPVFFRATEQWFASIEGFRAQALAAIRKVRWIPEWGAERIYNMIEQRGDWCISRQRSWGVPIPIFYCSGCGRELIDKRVIDFVAGLFRQFGSDVWFARPADELMPPDTVCPSCGGREFTKEKDIMDVWFDSGTSHQGVLDEPDIWPGLRWPADMYLEGSDQHRGWFNSSLCTSVAVKGEAPYRTVLTHGFVVDEAGRKMSKSLGNVIDPLKVIDQLGADILRLWISSVDYRSDMALSQGILKQLTEAYRKIRNTCRYLLANTYDFDSDAVPYAEMEELDRWALLRLHRTVDRVLAAYRNYDFHVAYHLLHGYCVVDLSALYLDVIKDRLYTAPARSRARRAAQTVCAAVLEALVRLLAPILTFTAEEIWGYLPKTGRPVSVQLAGMPEVCTDYFDPALEERWDALMQVRGAVTPELERLRREKVIGNSLEAAVELWADGDLLALLRSAADQLPTIFIVSAVAVQPGGTEGGLRVEVKKAGGAKCERCWMYHPGVGEDDVHPTLCPKCRQAVAELS
ncbi:MAG TPA: isoleucine--tRNA ligase [Spirochaetia bacterium]|nr:isoleucine--tRNA ligase [Spirochaetia bacterium]